MGGGAAMCRGTGRGVEGAGECKIAGWLAPPFSFNSVNAFEIKSCARTAIFTRVDKVPDS